MELTYGTICLEPLYEIVSNDTKGLAIKGESQEGRAYGKQASLITNSINENQGLYLWGKYTDSGAWRSIYLGKSNTGKTSNLRARILEELKDERLFLWWRRTYFSENVFLDLYKDHYDNFTPKSENNFYRSIKKWGTTHIIWVSFDDDDIGYSDIKILESDLIEILNPIVNDQRPPPENNLAVISVEIIKHLRDEIHRNREGAYKLKAI